MRRFARNQLLFLVGIPGDSGDSPRSDLRNEPVVSKALPQFFDKLTSHRRCCAPIRFRISIKSSWMQLDASLYGATFCMATQSAMVSISHRDAVRPDDHYLNPPIRLNRIPLHQRRAMNIRGESCGLDTAVACIFGSSRCSDMSAADRECRGCLCGNSRRNDGNRAGSSSMETTCCNNRLGARKQAIHMSIVASNRKAVVRPSGTLAHQR